MATLKALLLAKNQDLKNSYGNLHVLNSTELLFVPSSLHDASLLKFNLISKKWIKWFGYPDDYGFHYHSSALNDIKTKLYIFGDPGFVITVDLITGKFTKSEKEFHDGAHCQTLFYNQQFHIFGGWDEENNAHYIWDETKHDLEEIYTFNAFTTLRKFACIYLRSTNSVLFTKNLSLYQYNLSQRTLETFRMEMVMDNSLYVDRAIIASNEQYIIVISDCWKNGQLKHRIHLVDANTKKLANNYIDEPDGMSATTDLVVFSDCEITDYLSCGYLRQCSNDFPTDIARVISKFIVMEVVYGFNSKDGGLYEMRVDDIIKQCLNTKCE